MSVYCLMSEGMPGFERLQSYVIRVHTKSIKLCLTAGLHYSLHFFFSVCLC